VGAGQAVWVLYENHRLEVSWRYVTPLRLRYGVSEWHPGEQWLVDVHDHGKEVERTFALVKIHRWQVDKPERG
jgi:hypothetical protein